MTSSPDARDGGRSMPDLDAWLGDGRTEPESVDLTEEAILDTGTATGVPAPATDEAAALLAEPDFGVGRVPLDDVVDALQAGQAGTAELVEALLSTTLLVPSASDPSEGEFLPAMSDIDGRPHMVVGTAFEQLKDVAEVAQYVVAIPGDEVLAGLHADLGLLVLADGGAFDVSPELAAEIRAKNGL